MSIPTLPTAAEMRASFHGCVTGDCPHDDVKDCIRCLDRHVADLEKQLAESRAECERWKRWAKDHGNGEAAE